MPKWIKETYFWLVGRGYPADKLIMMEDYNTGKKKYYLYPENTAMMFPRNLSVGHLQTFIKHKADIKKRAHEKFKI
ncbi:MAG: hypothetical protein ACXAC5_05205 [Promethearchaeota archaeon]|jgi:hypothetical protein